MRCRSHIKTLLEEFVLGAEGRIFPALQAVCLLFLCFLWFFLLFCLAILITFILVLRHSVNRNALLRSKLKEIPQHLSLESRKMSRTQWTLSGFFKAGCDVWKNETPQCWFWKSFDYLFGITLFHWSCMEWECMVENQTWFEKRWFFKW